MSQHVQVPDVTRFDKTEDGKPCVWVGTVKAVPVFDSGDTVVISKSDIRDIAKSAYKLGWNGHVQHAKSRLQELITAIDL